MQNGRNKRLLVEASSLYERHGLHILPKERRVKTADYV